MRVDILIKAGSLPLAHIVLVKNVKMRCGGRIHTSPHALKSVCILHMYSYITICTNSVSAAVLHTALLLVHIGSVGCDFQLGLCSVFVACTYT